MHISSLPGNTGIGTLGKNAYEFADFLKAAGQSYWQVLPLCPTGYGDSPYQSFSTFAGNPYFIDFDLLCDEGLLKKEDYEKYREPINKFIDLCKKEAINVVVNSFVPQQLIEEREEQV